MSYLGGFMGGSPDYNSNPGILGLYNFIQSGYDAGKAKAQNQALAQLSQKAYTDTGDAQKQDVAQAIGIDPQTGYALAGKAQEQQSAQQAQKLASFQRLGKAASAIIQAKQAGDETTAEGIYQAIVPELGLMSAQHGGPAPPPNLQGADMGALYKVAAMYASLPQAQKGVVIAAGGELVNPTTGAKMASVPNKGQVVSGYYFDPNTGTASPIPIKGAQNGMGMGATVPSAGAGAAPQAPGLSASVPGTNGQNVTFDFPPGTPPQVIAAAKASAVANGDIAPSAPVGSSQGAPQTLAQAVAAGKSTSTNLIDQRKQQLQELKASGVQMTPEDEQQYLLTGKASNFQGGSNAALFGDPSKTGQEYVQSIPEGNREIVQGLLDYTQKLPSGSVLKSPLWQSAIASVKHADPQWNEAGYKQYAATRRDFTYGPHGDQINRLGTALQHLDVLAGIVRKMDNGSFTPYNKAANEGENIFSKGQLSNFMANLTPVATEVAAVYKGKASPTQDEIKYYREALSPNLSKAKQIQIIKQWTDLLRGKLDNLRGQYRDAMGPMAQPIETVKPEARAAYNAIQSLDAQLNGDSEHSLPAQGPVFAPGQQYQPASAASAPGGWSIEEVH